ncbi:hypothetical protein J1614_011011 [Plenodomus biglobosus]|nr:hypothetical protein J1614_011011 [Plenodomus biglobosus]
MDSETVYKQVHDRYSASALSTTSHERASTIAQAFGYSAEEILSMPAESNLGLSCGNPLAIARLQEGETVVDLGCGAGFDVFLAATKVQPHGKVVGVDMNQDMLAKARHNAAISNSTNVSFIQSRITSIDLPDAYADVIISNCVINLVPHHEKQHVFNEMYRILKPGGRIAVSDILARKPLPESLQRNVALYVGCIAGASTTDQYERWLREAGLDDVLVVDAGINLNLYTMRNEDSCCGDEGLSHGGISVVGMSCCSGTRNSEGGVVADMCSHLQDIDLNDLAGSFKVFAIKN